MLLFLIMVSLFPRECLNVTGSTFPRAMNNSLDALSGIESTMQGTIPLCPPGVNEPPKATHLLRGSSSEFRKISFFFIITVPLYFVNLMPLTFPAIMLLSFLLYSKSLNDSYMLTTSLHFTFHSLICFLAVFHKTIVWVSGTCLPDKFDCLFWIFSFLILLFYCSPSWNSCITWIL